MADFMLHSEYSPTGDQPEAIKTIVENFKNGKKHQTLLGVTGSGKTFTMANVIKALGENFKSDEILLSLMSQFTPTEHCKDIKKLSRRTTTFEYESVMKVVEELGFSGYFQQRTSAKSEYIPEFFNNKKVTN